MKSYLEHKITLRGLNITGEQVERTEFGILVLSDGILTSYSRSYTEETGFTRDDIAEKITNAVKEFVLESDKIVEIASNEDGDIRVRFSSGTAVHIMYKYGATTVLSVDTEVARITSNKAYKLSGNYYKSGDGDSQLVPLLEDDMLSVFDTLDGDKTVSIEDARSIEDAIIGFVGDYKVVGESGSVTIILDNDSVSGSSFGIIKREIDKLTDMTLYQTYFGRNGWVRPDSGEWGDNANVPGENDLSGRFAQSHLDWINLHREDHETQWGGFTAPGYVEKGLQAIDAATSDMLMGHTVVTNIKSPYDDKPQIRDTIYVAGNGGSFTSINSDGLLHDLESVSINGIEMVDFIYANDMSDKIAIGGDFAEVSKACVDGYFFAYPSSYWTDADLETI